jgi:hypothetical protein
MHLQNVYDEIFFDKSWLLIFGCHLFMLPPCISTKRVAPVENPKKRVALLMAGRINAYHQPWIFRMIERYNIDVFVSGNGRYDQEFIDLYKPKRYNFEKYKLDQKFMNIPSTQVLNIFKPMNSFSGPNIYGFASQTYNKFKCMNLIEDYQNDMGFEYDVIITSRCDLAYDDDVILDFDINDRIFMTGDHKDGNILTADGFYYSNYKMTRKICDYYKNIEDYHKRGFSIGITPENIIGLSTDYAPIVRIDFKWAYDKNRHKQIISQVDI